MLTANDVPESEPLPVINPAALQVTEPTEASVASSSVPPPSVTARPAGSAAEFWTTSRPAVTVVPPEWVFGPERIRVPVPCLPRMLAKALPSDTTPAIVVVPPLMMKFRVRAAVSVVEFRTTEPSSRRPVTPSGVVTFQLKPLPMPI